MKMAIETARAAGRKVAFTLSDGFCVDRPRADFRALIDGGQIDILFAHEMEARALTETDSLEDAAKATAGTADIDVVTRRGQGEAVLAGGDRTVHDAEQG